MKLYIECCNNDLKEIYVNNKANYANDSGFDLYCPDDVEINKFGNTCIDLGVRCWSPDGVGYQLVPRSSIYKHNIMMSNSVGIIDAGYTGNIKANVNYIGRNDNIGYYGEWILLLMTFLSGYSWLHEYSQISLAFTYSIALYNYFRLTKKYEEYIIDADTRLFQLVAFDGKPIDVEIVDELPEESGAEKRGSNGFGSTDDFAVESDEMTDCEEDKDCEDNEETYKTK